MDTKRQRATELVRLILAGAAESEAEADKLVDEFESLVPDPNASDLIFWPDHHPLAKDLIPEESTPERIGDLAYQHKPLAL